MACPGQIPAHYDEDDLQPVSELEHVRRRPAMYLGSTGPRGLHDLLFNLVTESLSEVVAGYGREVRVELRADGFAEVSDDGRPMDNVQFAFDRIGHGHGRLVGAGPTGRDDFAYAVANALSERLTVVARTPGSTYSHSFRRAVTRTAAQMGGPPDARGLTVTFLPDAEIFGVSQFDADTVRERLRQLAFLHSGVRLTFTDEDGERTAFEYGDGIREFVTHLNAARTPLHDVLVLRGEDDGVRYEVGLQWCAEPEEVRASFANHYRTTDGGTHQRGTLTGAATGLLDYVRAHAPEVGELTPDDRRTGLTAVVSVWLAEPHFISATRAELGNEEAEAVVRAAVRHGVLAYLEANPADAGRVVKSAVAERDERLRARRLPS